jgi:hypothetical protein
MLRRMLVGIAAVAALGAVTAAPAGASSHREAPLTTADPLADLTDVYAWVDRSNHSKVDFVMNAVPLEEAGDAPNYYQFGKNVLYDINIDRNGDGRDDLTFRFQFQTHYRNRELFLYNTGPVTTLRSPNLNIFQTYSVQMLQVGRKGRVTTRTLGRNLPVVPNNIGPRSTPNFGRLVQLGVRSLGRSGARVWAGQADDPFFLGLSQIGDLLNVQPAGKATDTLRGYNVQSIALQVPRSMVTLRRHPTIGIYGSTLRHKFTLVNGGAIGPWQQVERLGMPLTNEVLIGIGDKDRWNHVEPAQDSKFKEYLLNPVLAAALGAPAKNRQDILTVFDKGVPKLNATGGPLADLLRLNTSIEPSAHPNPLGVLGGDVSGFPNGRRLGDDVVDIELRVVAGALIGHPNQVSDGVQHNDQPFLRSFPYVPMAHQGFEHTRHSETHR